jgi:hypothetical protein
MTVTKKTTTKPKTNQLKVVNSESLELPKNPFIFEVLNFVSKQRTNSKKVEILKKYEDSSLKAILIWNFDETVISVLPPGEVPYSSVGEQNSFSGTLSEKIDPYLRPLFDALHEMLDPDSVPKLIATGTIEVAPLAYMRGRTLNDSFIILDEAQNTTGEQMKMFLTRLGFNSKMVITGDITQIDLPGGASGLTIATKVLDGVDDVHFAKLSSKDVIRHPLVGKIVDAYDEAAAQKAQRDSQK